MHKILSTPSTAAFSQPGLSTRHGHSRHLSTPTVGRLGTSIADRSRAETVVGGGRHALQHQQLKDKGKGKEREKVEEVKDARVRGELERLEEESKAARREWRVWKSVVGGIVAGSGVDWAGDPKLLEVVLDAEDEMG